MVVILGRLDAEGRGMVRPCSPTVSLSWEFRASSRRDEMGRRVAKSTYSPFVMAVVVVFVRWLAMDGWRKSGRRAATVTGSDGLNNAPGCGRAGKADWGVGRLCCCWRPSWSCWRPSWSGVGLGSTAWPSRGIARVVARGVCEWPPSCREASFSSMMDAITCASSACGAKLLSCTVRFKETSEPLCGLGTSWLASRRAMSCWRVPVCVRLCCASRRRRARWPSTES